MYTGGFWRAAKGVGVESFLESNIRLGFVVTMVVRRGGGEVVG